MSSNALHVEDLRKILHKLPSGMPISTKMCNGWGVSRQLAHWYAHNGWLQSLGYGYYLRPDDTVSAIGAVSALEESGFRVHIAGKTALSFRGYRHYLNLGKQTLHLYSRGKRSLPKWLDNYFKVELSTTKLFLEPEHQEARLFVRQLDSNDRFSPCVSDPERAVLEMLEHVPGKDRVDDVKEIMESMFSLNPEKLELLLKACTKVKIKRLFWMLCTDLGLPVLKDIKIDDIDFGAAAPYVVSGPKILVLPNPKEGGNENRLP